MSRLTTQLISQAGQYNFADDPNAGAIGTTLLGVVIPRNAIVTYFAVKCITAFVGAGTLSFGHQSNTLPPSPAEFVVATPAVAFLPNVPVQGVNLLATPFFAADFLTITMTIGGAPITAGRIEFFTWYNELTQ